MKRFTHFVACLLVLVLGGAASAQEKMPQRWNYASANLNSDAGLKTFMDVMQQSKDVGCTHILMPEGGWLKQADNPAYQARVDQVQAKATELGLTIVPCVYKIGYSGGYLGFDKNLAAGMPVKDMVFAVKGKTAVVDPAGALDVSNVKEGAGTLKCQPFMHYRITILTSEQPSRGEGTVQVTSQPGSRVHTRSNAQVSKQGDKWLVTTTFNSLQATDLRFSCRVKGITDLKIEPAGTLLVVRRAMCPLKVTNEDGTLTYEEGKDFVKIEDPMISGKMEGEFEDHKPADITIADGSRIKDGDKIKVSFFHTQRLGSDQDCISMDDPAVFKIMERDIVNCQKVWKPAGVFMNYDEIRLGGWEVQPDGKQLKPGELLANHVKKGIEMIRQYAPNAKIYTWSDMFTPLHNARPFSTKGYYYLVNGNWDGAWEGLPKDVIIMNWYSPTAEGIKFFADRGNPQVLCGYYDGTSTDAMKKNITNWMKVSQGQPQMQGFMYTTWRRNYKNLKEYFQLVDTYDQWGKGAQAAPEKEPGVAQ